MSPTTTTTALTSSQAPPADLSTGLPSGILAQPVHTRALSLDIFRGLTMAVMIFVNDLSDVTGLSRWTYHIPRNVDAMSYVDMVYPFFLFAVGLSLPLAIRQRLSRDPSQPRLWGHILQRAAALITLGLILANADKTSRTLTHLRGSLWALLALAGAMLLCAVYPKSLHPRVAPAARLFGAALLLTTLALFRRWTPTHTPAWLDFRYPEILGLIGLTYLATCLLYVPTRRLAGSALACFLLLLLFNIATAAHVLAAPRALYLFPFGNGSMPAITFAGILVSGIFLGNANATPADAKRPFLYALAFALTCAVLGLLLRPLGISKIRATPTWVLWSVSAATLTFTLLHWLCDRRHLTRWAAPFRAPGANTLLTYLLPDLTGYALALLGLSATLGRWNHGLPGVLRSVVFTGAMLTLSWLATRARLRLQL